MARFKRAARGARPRIVVVGAGVGGLEAALGLRATMGDVAHIELVSPESEFQYRAMTVAEPFGFARPPRIPLDRLEHGHGVVLHRDAVERVELRKRNLVLRDGGVLDFDDLIVAVGARPEVWLDEAITFTGAAGVPRMRELLERLDDGSADTVVFTAPEEAAWTLPVYELALMTAAWCGARALPGVTLHVVTPEAEPLQAFGPAATAMVRDLLADRGVTVHAGTTVRAFAGGRAELANSEVFDADAVVAMPRLTGHPIPGIPSGPDGFIEVDDEGRVRGVPHVYAIGDATARAIKQGGLAAQQADAAVAAIARSHGVSVAPRPYGEVMRGMLLTGVASVFFRANSSDTPDAAAFSALWWPPTKVAGRHLAAFLVDSHAQDDLDDRDGTTTADAAADRAEMRALALTMATADAQWGDWESAARWMRAVELIDGVLPEDLARLRDDWAARAAG